MVDDYIDIFEEEDIVKDLPTPGVEQTDTDILDINIGPSNIPGISDPLGDAAEYIIREGMEKDVTGYPKTIDLGDPTGIGIFRTPEQKAETSVSLAPAYRTLSEITDFVGFDIPQFLHEPTISVGPKKISLASFSPTAALGALGLEFLVGEGPGITLRTMEMEKPVSPFQVAELALVGFDAAMIGIGGTAGAKAAYKWLTQTVNKTPEEAFTIMKNNPQLADDDMVGKSIDELSDEEYEKLNMGAAVRPRKKKTAPLVATKETDFPAGLPLKNLDESLMKVKPKKDTLVNKTITKPEKHKVRKEISKNLKNYFTKKKDFTKKDLEKNIVTNTFAKSFNKVGIKRSNLEGNIREDYVRLNKTIDPETNKPYIDDQLLTEITTYQNKRRTLSGAIADRIKAGDEVATTRAKEATEFLGKKQKNIDTPIQMNKIVLYNQLAKAMPNSYKTDISATRKREIINELVEKNPELNKYLGLQKKLDEDTLAPEPARVTDKRRKEVEEELRKNYPDELIEGHTTKKGEKKPDFFLKEKKDLISIQQNPKFKFYEFLSRTMPESSMKTLFKNVILGAPSDLANPGQRLFNSFKKLEDIRKVVSPKITPLLERVYGIKNPSVQIAHTFKSSKLTPPEGIGKKEPFLMDIDPEEFIAQGVNPDFLYLDISPYNIGVQNRLEGLATKALREGNFDEFDKIDQLMTNVGIKGMVDNVPVGKQKKLSTKLRAIVAELRKRGDPIPEYDDVMEAIKILETSGPEGYAYGGMVEDDLDIFQDNLPKGYSYGGVVNDPGQFSDSVISGIEEDIDIKDLDLGPAYEGIEDLDIFEEAKRQGGEEVQMANLMLPFFKLFGKIPDNISAPIPTPKPSLSNPTKKQAESLINQKEKSSMEDIFDPNPDEKLSDKLSPDTEMAPISVTPLTKTPMTSVFYSDIERVLANAPKQFQNKQEVFDFLNKNKIRKSEATDYRIPQILKMFSDNEPIDTSMLIAQVRSAPIKGMKVHGTGFNSDKINPGGHETLKFEGYKEPGSIEGTARERVLIIPKNLLGKDGGKYPRSISGEGQDVPFHNFGQGEENFVIGWSRLTDRYGKVPQKVEGPKTKSNLKKLKKDKEKLNSTLKGLMAEAETKLHRLATSRGMNQADIDEITVNNLNDLLKYKDQLDEISPGLVDQIDELGVKSNDLVAQISKAETPSAENIVRVTFADEIQSDLMQAAATRKKFLAGTLRRLQEQGTEVESLNEWDSLSKSLLKFYKENETVFRPTRKTAAEVDILRKNLTQMDQEVDKIVNNYITTREISDESLDKLRVMLEDNMNDMLDKVLTIDSTTMEKLFPDMPFKNRSEWGDAVIKKDLYEAAYRKFILKDPLAADYYAVSPGEIVAKRWNFSGDTSTPTATRLRDKEMMLKKFKETGELSSSQLKGVGVNEFYGGPTAKAPKKYAVVDKDKPIKEVVVDTNGEVVLGKDGKPKMEITGYEKVKDYTPTENVDDAWNYVDVNKDTMGTNYEVITEQKHYTGDLEKILQKQATDNNSELITMPVALKQGSKNVYKITDQNGNMVATLSDAEQARNLQRTNPNYNIEPIQVPDEDAMKPVFAIKITKEMLEPYVTHKAQGGLVEDIDIFEVA